jgi:archaemetzincin
MHITLVLLGRTVPGLPQLLETLAKTFGASVSYQFVDLPFTRSFRNSRKQYDAELFLKEMSHLIPMAPERMLYIIREDIFAGGSEYVFGYSMGRCSIISLTRLDPRFYGEVPAIAEGAAMLKERMVKEALHELGHTFLLGHCDDKKCLMALSGSLEAVDSKGSGFCKRCGDIIKSSKG